MSPPRAVIVGAGQAGFQAACSLRQLEFPGEVVLLSDEAEPPYARPPLSKEQLTGAATADTVGFRPAAFYRDKDIEPLVVTRWCRSTGTPGACAWPPGRPWDMTAS